jgi:hypothetical protein
VNRQFLEADISLKLGGRLTYSKVLVPDSFVWVSTRHPAVNYIKEGWSIKMELL